MSWFTTQHLIPLLLAGIGLFLLFSYYRNLARVRESEGWPASQGTIVQSWVRESETTNDDGSASSSYYPELRYTYSVMGSEYQGEKIAFGLKTGGARSKAEKVISQYPQGSTVTVYYDPNKPETAVLERSVPKLFLIYGIVMIAVAVFLFITWN